MGYKKGETIVGRHAKFKLYTKKNGLLLNAKGEKDSYGVVSQTEKKEDEIKRYYYIS